MKKIILFRIGSMQGGGAEKVLLSYIQNLPKDYYSITLLLNIRYGIYLNQIPKHVKVIAISEYYGERKNPVRIIGAFWNLIKQKMIHSYPGLIDLFWIKTSELALDIAFIQSLAPIVLRSKAKTKWVWSHSDPINVTKHGLKLNHKYNSSFLKFDRIVFVSNLAKKNFIQKYPKSKEICTSIYNPVNSKEIIEKSIQPSTIDFNTKLKNVVSIGRLAPEKGFDRLIYAFAEVITTHKELRLHIIGEGIERKKLIHLIKKLKLVDFVRIYPYTPNPYPAIRNADILVSASDYEGFALTIAEALVLETKVVATKTAGAIDLLEGGLHGFLCEFDSKDMAEKIIIALRDNKSNPVNRDYWKFDADTVLTKLQEELNLLP